jgi:Leucine-rich repeat (LRR) protein
MYEFREIYIKNCIPLINECFDGLQISHSSLEDLAESSLRGLSKSLESLAIVSSRLRFIPQTTLSTLKRLKSLDLEGNQVAELGPYAFHNILLQKVKPKTTKHWTYL